MRCLACGLMFVATPGSQSDVHSQYRDNQRSPAEYYQTSAETDRSEFDQRLGCLEGLRSPGRLLDIGCGVGTFLESARRRGWNGEGVEPNPRSADIARQKGFTVSTAFLEDLSPRAVFDVVTMNDVLEHFTDPLSAVQRAAAFIRPGGVLALNTPNVASPLVRLFQIKPREHLFYFSPLTLASLLECAGMNVLLLRESGRRRDFQALSSGATLGRRWAGVAGMIHRLRLEGAANMALTLFFRDELFSVAERKTSL